MLDKFLYGMSLKPYYSFVPVMPDLYKSKVVDGLNVFCFQIKSKPLWKNIMKMEKMVEKISSTVHSSWVVQKSSVLVVEKKRVTALVVFFVGCFDLFKRQIFPHNIKQQ